MSARYDKKIRRFMVIFSIAAVFIILGGIATCSSWLNSLPEREPKGAIDNPEIKQWMKKNMEKRGDRYYLK